MLACWLAFLTAPKSGAAQAEVHAYAVVVGNNIGGAGQGTLSFAERDAERVAQLLTELGRTPRQNIQLLERPGTRDLELALARVRQQLLEHASRGERTQVMFYYSGHARAHALSLGSEELSLETLRAALVALPSTLTVVVLDACQSGAFSGVKGAAPAADFSVSSVNDLHSEGIAVMASSTAAELSQESSALGSSYFSHHLLVALRGPGDVNGDGHVSLDEAYRYAYQNTLADTARTQVGSQHATLETDLTGRGDVPLTYPVDADAQLALPAALEGRVLVQKEQRGAVMAELIKAPGAELRIALPSGRYEVLLRREGAARAHACSVELTHGQIYGLSLDRCREVTGAASHAKGTALAQRQLGDSEPLPAQAERRPDAESWFVELGLGGNSRHDDAYTQTLRDFRFQKSDTIHASDGIQVAAGWGVHRYVSLLARYDTLERRRYQRDLEGPDQQTRDETFEWVTRAISVGARARLPLLDEWVVGFIEGAAGFGFARSWMTGDHVHATDANYGVALRGAAGFTFGFWKYVGAYVTGGYTYAPVLSNRIGQTHDDGGYTIAVGLRVRGLKGDLK